MTIQSNVSENLKTQWQQMQAAKPGVRIRNAAKELGVSEVELLATSCGETCTRLRPEFKEIFERLGSLGKVMGLTRNDEVVHERKGVYQNFQFQGRVALFVGAEIDLRIFPNHWKFAFAVTEGSGDKARYSLQFFNGYGEAVHKIYLLPESNFDAYRQIISDFTDADQSQEITVQSAPEPAGRKDADPSSMHAFQQEWRTLKDTHDFYMLMHKYGLTRLQALENAPEGFAVRVSNQVLRNALTGASQHKIPVMLFAGNEGMLQIHTGAVENIVDHEHWLNVLDPEFNLHVNEPAIEQIWLVKKPTSDGMVTSLEIFNKAEYMILQMFGKRKPGIPEDIRWTEFANTLK